MSPTFPVEGVGFCVAGFRVRITNSISAVVALNLVYIVIEVCTLPLLGLASFTLSTVITTILQGYIVTLISAIVARARRSRV